MTVSTNDGTGLKFLEEGDVNTPSTYGVRLTAGARNPMLFTSEDLRYVPDEQESEEIDGTGWPIDAIRYGQSVAGTIETYMRKGMMDHPWAASMRSDAATADRWLAEVDLTGLTADYATPALTITGGGSDFTNIVPGRVVEITDSSANVGYAQVTAKAADVLTIVKIRFTNGTDWSTSAGAITGVRQLEHVKPGDTAYGFNIERTPGGLSNEYHTFLGCVFDGWEMTAEAKQPVKFRWPIQGRDETTETSEFGGSDATAINITTQPAFSVNQANVAFLTNRSVETQVTSVTMSYAPGLRPRDTIGAGLGPSSFGYGKHRVTGTMRIFYEDTTRYTRFRDETLTSIILYLVDGAGNGYFFSVPNVKLRTGDRSTPRQEEDRFEEYEFSALYDTTDGTGFVLSRDIS